MSKKSPFYIVEEFISPLMCEDITAELDFTVPDTDKDGHPIKSIRTNETAERVLYERLLVLLPELQGYYQTIYKGTERMKFEWFPEGSVGDNECGNSVFVRGKWLRDKQRDFTAILFLSDFQDKPAFEKDFEVYGGKLEFAQHSFGFNPTRGTLVVFPSDPHFINTTSRVQIGDLFQVRIQIAATQAYLYDPKNFPGNYTSWFAPLLPASA